MYDLSRPNARPGTCCKCGGTGTYSWGGTVNGVPRHSGTCFSCRGTGRQSASQIKRNQTYNRHKIASFVVVEAPRSDIDEYDHWNGE